MIRKILAGMAMLALTLSAGTPSTTAAEVGADGLHKQPWFSVTFKDIREDMGAAKEAGKRLVLIFEQRGCIYCRKMHEVLLADPKIAAYIKANFMVVRLNMFGDEDVTDLDGKQLTEKTAARRWGLLFTPTLMFMPEVAPKGGTAAEAAVAKMPGAFGKNTFLHLFQWVREKGYEKKEHFQKYHARRLNEERAARK